MEKKHSTAKQIAIMIGENVLFFRKQHGFSQEALGEKIGSDQHHISKIEKGINITSITLLKLALALEISLDELIYANHQEKMSHLIKTVILYKDQAKEKKIRKRKRRGHPNRIARLFRLTGQQECWPVFYSGSTLALIRSGSSSFHSADRIRTLSRRLHRRASRPEVRI